jgi:hypothetical protein
MGIFANRRRVPPGRFRYLALVALVISWGSQAIGGQTTSAGSKKTEWKLPRTADGQPDLQGVWNYGQETPLQRPAEFAGKDHVTAEEAARYDEQMAARRKARANGAPNRYSGEVFDDVLAKADWTKRTSLITDPPDGKMPPITPLAEARRADRRDRFANPAGPEDTGLADRCILGWHSGPPIIPGNQSNVLQLFQSRHDFVIYNELNHEARVVPVNGRPSHEPAIREYAGVSSGRWEKDTLVVETTSFTSQGVATLTFSQSGGTDENEHLIERFTRTGPDTLLYEFTITDPTTWTRPWSAAVPMKKTDEHIYEYACHEGNISMETMLAAAREADKAGGGAAKKAGGARQSPSR